MGDTDFPTILGNGGNSYGFLQGWKERLQGGSVDNTQLPTTGEYAQYQQTMQDGQFSPVDVDYGQFVSNPQGSTGGSTGPFDPAYLQKMSQPGTPMPEWMRRNPSTPQTPGESGAKQAFDGIQFPTPFGGSSFDIAAGPSFDIPKGQGALGGRSGEQLLRLQQGSGNMQNQQLQNELQRRGMLPSGIQLPPV
jgi:hypothetical protein